MSNLRHWATWLAPDLALAVSFLLAWVAPSVPGAATLDDCRTILILQGLAIVAAVLVGGYRETALVFLPLVLVACVVWLFVVGTAGLTLAWASFVWSVVGAFDDGLRAHRGEFGLARENPDHPHRRYDRLVLLYVGTAVIFPVLWALGVSARWAVWGTIYFALSAAVDTFLRDAFDRIPRAILRRLKQWARSPEIDAQLGLCRECVYVQPAIPAQPGRAVRCLLSLSDAQFPEYPATPIQQCDGFRRAAE